MDSKTVEDITANVPQQPEIVSQIKEDITESKSSPTRIDVDKS